MWLAKKFSGRFFPSCTSTHSTKPSRLVNSDPRGNGTSIFTENGAAVREYSRRVEVGMVGVNIGVAASPAYFPFSGWKDSFFGDLHVHGWDAIEFFTRKKTITSRYFSAGTTGKFFTEQGDKH